MMMNNEWRISRNQCEDGVLVIEDSDGITVCELAFTAGDEEKVARLIASATRLLSACKTHGLCLTITDWIEGTSVRQPREKNLL